MHYSITFYGLKTNPAVKGLCLEYLLKSYELIALSRSKSRTISLLFPSVYSSFIYIEAGSGDNIFCKWILLLANFEFGRTKAIFFGLSTSKPYK